MRNALSPDEQTPHVVSMSADRTIDAKGRITRRELQSLRAAAYEEDHNLHRYPEGAEPLVDALRAIGIEVDNE